MTPAAADVEAVAALLGRRPQGEFEVVVRTRDGVPAVLRNAPLLDDGTPMPTRYWLTHPALRSAIGTVESHGGVRRAEAALDPAEVAAAHSAHGAERDAALPPGHTGPRPTGGIGGTRRGVKCLHAHYAHWLAGSHDPVGAWVHEELLATDTLPVDAPERIQP